MEYVNLGRAGVQVSRACLGGFELGRMPDDESVFALLDRVAEHGINFVDSANVYGPCVSEERIGKWLESRGNRHEMVIATKFETRMRPDPNGWGTSRYHMMQEVHDSLKRLRTDRIDLYYVHNWNDLSPIDETLRAFDDLIQQGKVLYIGLSCAKAWQLCKALFTSDLLGVHRFVAMQNQYNLLVTEAEDEVLPLCADQGVGFVAYSPIAGGMLTGKYKWGVEPPADTRMGNFPPYRQHFFHKETIEKVDRLKPLAREYGVSVAILAEAWVASNPLVLGPIVGAKTTEQLDEDLKAFDLKLTEEERQHIVDVLEGVEA